MKRLFFISLLAFHVSLALASSCEPDEAAGADAKIAAYRESKCALKALDKAADLLRDALLAESRSESKTLCANLHAALMQLDQYRVGAWRKSHRNIAEKIDASFDEKLARMETTTCPQKLALYRHLALQGNPWAMFRLADSYAKGTGLAQNDGEALAWYQLAAEHGYAPAYVALGLMYSDGKAFVPDYGVAAQWLDKGARKGDAEAEYRLGNLLRKGRGISQDPKAAAEWYRKAAEQGHADAQFALTEMYRSGEAKKPFFGY